MKNMIEKPCNKEALKAAKVLKNYCASHACPEDWIIGEEEEVL